MGRLKNLLFLTPQKFKFFKPFRLFKPFARFCRGAPCL